jgi:hypothetical protein
VRSVTARNQSGPGLFLEGTRDCTVDAYSGLGNEALGSRADVWIGGVNDRIGKVDSRWSGSGGVLVRPYAERYRVGSVSVLNPAQRQVAGSGAGVVISGGSGEFGRVVCRDNQARPTMSCGADVWSSVAVGRMLRLVVSGQTGQPVKNRSRRFRFP